MCNIRTTRERAMRSSVAKPTPSERWARQSPARCQAGRSTTGASPDFSGGKLHFVHVNSVIVELLGGYLDEKTYSRMKGGELNARHEEVGGDESPGKLSPPRRTSLIEGYALNFLDVAIPSYAFSFKEGL
jgi:hypothetical protein